MTQKELSFRIRIATRGDIESLVDLMRGFYAEAGFALDEESARSSFSDLFENPSLGCVWLAEGNDEPLGHAVMTVRYTMEHAGLSGYIDDLYVRASRRRYGIAKSLLQEIVGECRRRECRSLYVEVGDNNVPALDLYGRFGLERFQDGRTLLHRELRAEA
jgi:ribosomal protein S18 acetylase RimI-like enzyme